MVIAVLVGIGAVMMTVTCFVAALVAGAYALHDAGPSVIMSCWVGVTVVFLFFWLIGLITELQRSETIDLQKLMHMPVVLGQLFVINYLVSHFTFSIIVMVPMMLGLAMGMAFSHGPMMLLLVPLVLSMVLMITAWTYCLRGWLASLMSNPRRRRTVIMCISLSFVLLAQGPNLYFNVFNHNPGSRHNVTVNANLQMINNLVAVQRFIPPFWVPIGARGLAENNVLPALFGTLGCLGLAALGLRRAYLSTVKFYQGGAGKKTAVVRKSDIAAAVPSPSAKSGRRFLEWNIPAVPEQSAALALATFRSLIRAPEVKMALASSVIAVLIAGGAMFVRSRPNLPDIAKPFIATGVAMFSTFLLIQFFANTFGFDRDGFRTLILSPADRRLILFGKNLAMLPVGFGLGGFLVILTSIWLRLPPVTVLAALFQLASMLLISCIGGNLLSILLPFRIQPGTMKPTKMPALAMVIMVLCQFLVPLVMLPVFAAPLLELLWRKADLPPYVPINLICSAVLCGIMVFFYWQVLGPLGRLLRQRETKILGVVTVEVE